MNQNNDLEGTNVCVYTHVLTCFCVCVYRHESKRFYYMGAQIYVYVCIYTYTCTYNMHVRMCTFNINMGQPGPTRAGTPLLNIPAFLVAISSTVDPRMRVWSSAVVCVCV